MSCSASLALDTFSDYLTGRQINIALAAVLLLVLVSLWRGGFTISFSSGSFLGQLATGLLLLGLLSYVLWQIKPDAPLFNTPEGWGHLALYVVLIIASLMVATHYSGFKFFLGVATVILLFSLVGHRSAQLYDPDGPDQGADRFLLRQQRQIWSGAELRRGHARVIKCFLTQPDGQWCRLLVRYSVKDGALQFCTDAGQCTNPIYAGREVALSQRSTTLNGARQTSDAIVHIAFCPKGRNWNGSRCSQILRSTTLNGGPVVRRFYFIYFLVVHYV